jgi:hypothetical protein
MTWKPDELSFDFRYELTFGQVVTVRIQTPAGAVFAMAEVEERWTDAGSNGFHMHAEAGRRALGAPNVRMLAQHVMEVMDYDEPVIQGAARTSGARPGRIPGRLRFSRRDVPSPGSKP